MDLNRKWRFDEEVAIEFEAHARQNIPGYEPVIRLSLDAVRAVCRPHDKIAEIGCATGFTLRLLEQAGFENIVGVDCSPAMLEQCRADKAQLLCSERFPREHGPFKAVLINWTLHFVPPARRAAYLQDIADSLTLDGILILTDKTTQSPLLESHYHDFKRRAGMSESDIAAKKRSLVGVLETLPHEWYAHTLKELGFTTEILWAQYGFVTYLAHRRPL